ncbi:hypothetical protein [Endozoicomonas arenosclerae]|uniref:hypothetical protein n=1 Tax=Endozoicomonas arenosclerae TaxID=1633495 RepID=UPI0007851A97|nr:hypothetical protein [Endozoicomonas arenosclerae]
MIYRIHPEVKQFQRFALDADEVEDKLGEDCLIYMDSQPTQYKQLWQPIHIEFYRSVSSKTDNPVPDISCDQLGKLYLSLKAYNRLFTLLQDHGEFLPVEHEDGTKAYLFNPLVLAEDLQAIDQEKTCFNEWDELERIAFIQVALKETPIFRTEVDCFQGIYCQERFKQLVEDSALQGLIITDNLHNQPPT